MEKQSHASEIDNVMQNYEFFLDAFFAHRHVAMICLRPVIQREFLREFCNVDYIYGNIVNMSRLIACDFL